MGADPEDHGDIAGRAIDANADHEGYFWVGRFTGLYRYHPVRQTVERFVHDPADPSSLSENTGLAVFVDRNGVVFVGTHAGLSVFAPWQIKFTTIRHVANDPRSLSWSNVRGFAEDGEGVIWVATMRGVNRAEASDRHFTRFGNRIFAGPDYGDDIVWAIAFDSSRGRERLWVGTNSRGALVATKGGRSSGAFEGTAIEVAEGCITHFTPDGHGGMWVGILGGGIARIDDNLRMTSLYRHDPSDPSSLSNDAALSSAVDSRGRLWVGTDDGLNLMVGPGRFTVFKNVPGRSNTPSSNNILSLYPAGDTLWFGTYAGLNCYNMAKDSFFVIDQRSGLPNDVVYAILPERDGNLWLSTNAGIVRYDPRSGDIRVFSKNDGLQSNEFNQRPALLSRKGFMYFGGVDGYNVFHPDSLTHNPHAPRVVLTEFRVMNRPLRPGRGETRLRSSPAEADTLFLSYRDAVLTFHFAAIDYANPAANRYAYRMVGFDEQWVQAGTRREVTYTNLDPGEYTFLVAASNNDGVWNHDALSIAVLIEPPFWKTAWFRAVMVLLFLSSGPIVYYRRVTKLKKDVAVQQEFSRRLIESQETERARIARELHDGLGQDLLVVKNRAVLGLKSARPESKEAVQLHEISETIMSAIKDVREIARNLRPYQLDSLGFSEAVSLFRVIQETTNNLVKHSGAKEAEFCIERKNGATEIRIRDRGKGFDVQRVRERRSGLGLTGIAERVRMMGGTYTLVSEPGKGTRHTIVLGEKSS
jgi:signal transduction histidine kinase/ligand-binding sensor domain-containing protein